ncbi:hypothetical protein SAMN05216167_101867 [Spirosoma endophyticum]|uniref:Uncharacterized protein n=1 Tax=Spirosoma endophyticum TaxID=662367 RepID=A0A1I1I8B3_9BACT|nr:hypothetical protein SAMN05216167_101867 [Spirosoma endophyticum]
MPGRETLSLRWRYIDPKSLVRNELTFHLFVVAKLPGTKPYS